MSNPISPALDPASYLALSANLASGLGDPETLAAQSDALLSHCQAGDYSVMIRHHNSLIIAAQMSAHSALHKSMQCDNPAEADRWLASAARSQAMADAATLQVIRLTDTETKLMPYRQRIQSEATQTARLILKRQEVRAEALQLVNERLQELEPLQLKAVILDDCDWPMPRYTEDQ